LINTVTGKKSRWTVRPPYETHRYSTRSYFFNNFLFHLNRMLLKKESRILVTGLKLKTFC